MAIRVLASLGTLSIRVIILLLALAFITSEMAFALTDEEHWEATGISQADVQNFVNTKNCYQNENNFLGCIAAINSLLATSNPEKILSNKQISHLPEMKESIAVVERLQINNHTPLRLDNNNLVESWKVMAQAKSTINKSWKGLYAVSKNKPISMEALFNSALSFADQSYLKYKLANAENAYFRSAIDPHTYITPKTKWEDTITSSEKLLVGIGVYVVKLDDKFILKLMDNGPALTSGLRSMDVLEKIDGQTVETMTQDDVVKLIRGTEKTPVTLTVSRKGINQDITIVRSTFINKKIFSKLLVDPLTKRKIGYIKLTSFMELNACNKFEVLARSLHQQGAENLILDLRDNGGGLLNEALCMASLYTDKGKVILTENNPQTNQILTTHRSTFNAPIFHLYKNKPLFILQNADSASASEVLTGALVTQQLAITVGARSFGKGTVQHSQEDVKDVLNGIKMMKTQSRFHFASGASNQILGIQPDIEVYAKPNPTDNDKFAIREIDSYPNAIISSKPLQRFPAFATNAIKNCVRARNQISREFDPESSENADYQLLMAREAASCDLPR
jgi:carboxyl-terminal processing protease